MFKKTAIVALAATIIGIGTLSAVSSTQTGELGETIAAGVVDAVIGSAASPDRSTYQTASSGDACGFAVRPILDDSGNKVGVQSVPVCQGSD